MEIDLKIVTVIGARPQFIKAAAVSRAIRQHNYSRSSQPIREVIVHTGQHYDQNMSQVFFDELDIPRPDYNLEVGSGTHGAMTGKMLERIEKVLLDEKPDYVVVYGDTNSTIAGALAASKIHIPVAHVEAGLRSYSRRMPEEINRVLTDHISTILFCPTETAVENLAAEGIRSSVLNVGDVMYDASLFYRDRVRAQSDAIERLGIREKGYALVTCHRAENTDDPVRLRGIVEALAKIAESTDVVFPVHPRAHEAFRRNRLLDAMGRVKCTSPLSFLDMMRLEQSARVILTDSGGVQKEACFFGVPCLTLRDETEWVETVQAGWNTLVGADSEKIVGGFQMLQTPEKRLDSYGDGTASQSIVSNLLAASA